MITHLKLYLLRIRTKYIENKLAARLEHRELVVRHTEAKVALLRLKKGLMHELGGLLEESEVRHPNDRRPVDLVQQPLQRVAESQAEQQPLQPRVQSNTFECNQIRTSRVAASNRKSRGDNLTVTAALSSRSK